MVRRADPSLQPATAQELDAALRPFIERFVLVGRRPRCAALFLPLRKRARARDLIESLDERFVIELSDREQMSQRKTRTLAALDPGLAGVFLDENSHCWRTQLGQALTEVNGDHAIFVVAGGACGVVHFDLGPSWLVIHA
jgi:hypothetical protein